MAEVNVTHARRPGGVEAVLYGGVRRDLLRRGVNVANQAKRTSRVNSGRLRASYGVREINIGSLPVVVVGSDVEYAIWVERRYHTLQDALRAAAR